MHPSEEFHAFMEPVIYNLVHRIPPLDPFLSQLNSVRFFASHLSKVRKVFSPCLATVLFIQFSAHPSVLRSSIKVMK